MMDRIHIYISLFKKSRSHTSNRCRNHVSEFTLFKDVVSLEILSFLSFFMGFMLSQNILDFKVTKAEVWELLIKFKILSASIHDERYKRSRIMTFDIAITNPWIKSNPFCCTLEDLRFQNSEINICEWFKNIKLWLNIQF